MKLHFTQFNEYYLKTILLSANTESNIL